MFGSFNDLLMKIQRDKWCFMCLDNLHCVHATNRLHLRPKAASKHSGQEAIEQHAEDKDMVGLWTGLHWQLKSDGDFSVTKVRLTN